MRIVEAERELLRQLTDDHYRPGWHRMTIAPRSPMGDNPHPPPPYE